MLEGDLKHKFKIRKFTEQVEGGKKMRKGFMLMLVLSMIILLSSCQESKKSDDRSEIENLINNDYAGYFNVDGTSGSGEPTPGNGNMPNATATQPEHWWRTLSKTTRVITIDFPYEGHALAEVDDTLDGVLYVDRSFDWQLNPNLRNYTCKRTKYATFDKYGDNWYLTGISLGRWYMTNEANQKVKIISMRVVATGYDKTFTDATTVVPLDEWPRFSGGESVEVTLVTTNSSTSGNSPVTFSYLHYPYFNRTPMLETPTNTFKQSFPASGYYWGWGILAGDAIDSQTLQTESGTDYNWDVWVMPFKIE